MRTVVCGDPEFEPVAREVLAGADLEFKARPILALGSAAYVAHAPEHLERYEAWFPGLAVRINSRLRHLPLEPGAAMYLPVTFDAWVVVVDGAGALGAALETASLLDVQTLVLPGFEAHESEAVKTSLSRAYRRWQDRIFVA